MPNLSGIPARIVVTADQNGRSRIAAEFNSPTRVDTDVFSAADIWATSTVPVSVDGENALESDLQLEPPHGGVLVRMVSFPPDAEWQTTASGDRDPDAGMHTTATVDVVTVISGELVAVLEDEEVVLRVGDSIIQRGTRHAWSNRTDSPAVIVVTLISATR